MTDAPKHFYLHPREIENDFGTWHAFEDGDASATVRCTLTSGPEWGALMKRARASVAPIPELTLEQMNAMSNAALDHIYDAVRGVEARQVIRDLLAYLGEQT